MLVRERAVAFRLLGALWRSGGSVGAASAPKSSSAVAAAAPAPQAAAPPPQPRPSASAPPLSPGPKTVPPPAAPVEAAAAVEDPATYARVLDLLRSRGATFGTQRHAPTRTSEESAAVRGVPLASGAKAMLMKAAKELPHGGVFILAVMSAEKTANWPKLRKIVDAPKLAMASVEDVQRVTGCIPGAVPPFGSLFPGTRTFVDRSVVAQGPEINFNAGLRTESVLHLSVAEYLAIEKPFVCDFT